MYDRLSLPRKRSDVLNWGRPPPKTENRALMLQWQVCSGQVSVDEAIVDCCSSGVLAELSAYFVCVVPEIGEDFALTTTAMPQQLVAHHRRGRENIVPPPVRGNERRMFL